LFAVLSIIEASTREFLWNDIRLSPLLPLLPGSDSERYHLNYKGKHISNKPF